MIIIFYTFNIKSNKSRFFSVLLENIVQRILRHNTKEYSEQFSTVKKFLCPLGLFGGPYCFFLLVCLWFPSPKGWGHLKKKLFLWCVLRSLYCNIMVALLMLKKTGKYLDARLRQTWNCHSPTQQNSSWSDYIMTGTTPPPTPGNSVLLLCSWLIYFQTS